MNIIREEKFGTLERIEQWIIDEGLTQEEFEERTGVTNRTLRRWKKEREERIKKGITKGVEISQNSLKKIAQAMQCDIEYLECKQNTPKKITAHHMKLSELSIVDRYLPKIQHLVETTSQNFTYSIGATSDSYETIIDSFIDGETRYYYEDIVPNCNSTTSIYYQVSVNGADPVKKTEAEMNDFVKGIMKYISFEIEQLKE